MQFLRRYVQKIIFLYLIWLIIMRKLNIFKGTTNRLEEAPPTKVYLSQIGTDSQSYAQIHF
jgi:hypothetical protein